jgi:hypothetical protein
MPMAMAALISWVKDAIRSIADRLERAPLY